MKALLEKNMRVAMQENLVHSESICQLAVLGRIPVGLLSKEMLEDNVTAHPLNGRNRTLLFTDDYPLDFHIST